MTAALLGWFRARRQVLLGGALVVLFASGIAWFATRDYTVLDVNGTRVSLSRFTTNYRAAAHFRANAIEAYKRDPSGASKAPEPINEPALKAAVLTQFVDATLVEQGAREVVGPDLDALVRERVDRYRHDNDLAQAARVLYGISVEDFTNEVLVPQAMSEILRGRLFIQGKAFSEWIGEARRTAKVTIFSDQFRWDGTRIVVQQ